MGFIKRSQYLHYHQEDDYARFSQRKDLEGAHPYEHHSEMEAYFFPARTESKRDAPHFSRFKMSGYVNGYGMGHFNRYSTSDAMRGVGVHPVGVAPKEYYNPRDLGEEGVRSQYHDDAVRARMNR
jgi:hypothetical protein